jgi:hypothetical protein
MPLPRSLRDVLCSWSSCLDNSCLSQLLDRLGTHESKGRCIGDVLRSKIADQPGTFEFEKDIPAHFAYDHRGTVPAKVGDDFLRGGYTRGIQEGKMAQLSPSIADD